MPALLRVELDDQLLLQRDVDLRALRQLVHEDALTLADNLQLGKYFLIAHPHLMLGKLKGQILKKDRQPMYRLQRSELLSCGFGEAMAEPVLNEVMRHDGVTHRLRFPVRGARPARRAAASGTAGAPPRKEEVA